MNIFRSSTTLNKYYFEKYIKMSPIIDTIGNSLEFNNHLQSNSSKSLSLSLTLIYDSSSERN